MCIIIYITMYQNQPYNNILFIIIIIYDYHRVPFFRAVNFVSRRSAEPKFIKFTALKKEVPHGMYIICMTYMRVGYTGSRLSVFAW